MSYERCFSEVRSLLQGEINRQAFLAICAQVELAAALDLDACIAELIPYAQEALKAWPSAIKMAPMLWINRLIYEALPLEALHLCSALSLLAAMTEDHWAEQNERLFEWLEALPEDSPALEGLSIGRSEAMCKALRAAVTAEPQERFHPHGSIAYLATEPISPFDVYEDHSDHIFSSPLCRHLRVFDASYDDLHKFSNIEDFGHGREVNLGLAINRITSDRLEALGLHGQHLTTEPVIERSFLSPQELSRIKGLKALDLGGGYYLGDESITELAKGCPQLEWLNISPGYLVSDLFIEEEEDWDAEQAAQLGVYSEQDLAAMTLTATGLNALKKLKNLQRLHILEPEQAKPFEANGVEVITNHSIYAGALWARYFEL